MRSPSPLSRPGSSRRPLAGALGAVALTLAAAAVAQTPAGVQIKADLVPSTGKHLLDKNYVPLSLVTQDIQVMVELDEPAAISVYSDALHRRHLSKEQSWAEAEAHAARLEVTHKAVRQQLKSAPISAQVLFNVKHAYNGIAVAVRPGSVDKIRAIAGVKDVHGLQPKQRTANSSINFLSTPSFWNTLTNGGLNLHGEGLKIGVIDSGIDYIHVNFGGSGSPADYQANLALTTTAPNKFFPNAIVAGGYDLAGDAYDATSTDATPGGPTYNPVPAPDPNPFDAPSTADKAPNFTIGHGTACASIVAGRGVSANGTTFTGPYDSTVPLGTQLIGPGLAPAASIYSYRVFGNFGSTNLVVAGVDRAIQDRMDVISLSLGADFGDADSPDAAALDNASQAGVICVAAAGNAGDTYFDTGSPAASTRNISVAATYNSNALLPFATANAPTSLKGQQFAITPGSAGPPVPPAGLTGDVVYALPHIGLAQNADGTFPNLTNAAAINGHIALIDRGTYSFYVKVAECQQAGATAVILANNQAGAVTPATSSATYTPTIPNGIVSQADGNTIKATLDATNGTDTGTNVTIANLNGQDNLPSYTSRGPRRSDGLLKPDVAAPAEAVDTANHNTGTGSEAFNGTSSATPHVAGTMALLRQLHPTWTVEQLKALVMNTADRNLFSLPNGGGANVGQGRIGNGRLDLAPASKANVVAYSADIPGAVSVSFGSLDVPVDGGTFTATRTVSVVNKGATAAAFNLGVTSLGTDVPGVAFTVPATVTVPAATVVGGTTRDGTASLVVTLTANPAAMKHTHDPSIALTQAGNPRHWKSEAAGYLTFTPTTAGATPIRLTLHALPRPVSTVHAASANFTLAGPSGTATIPLTGTGVATGNALPTDIVSLLKVMELQYAGTPVTAAGSLASSADLQYVGVSSDYAARANSLAATVFNFGIVAFGDHAAPDAFNTEFDVNIDTTGGTTFTPNYTLYNFLLGTSPNYTNEYVPFIVKLSTGAASTAYYTNGFSANLDSNIFNNNVLTYPVPASSLGMTATSNPRIHYQVNAFYNNVLISQTPVLTYDPTQPGLTPAAASALTGASTEPRLDQDASGSTAVNYVNGNLVANRSLGALLLHFHNAAGLRADAVQVAQLTLTGFTPASAAPGQTVTLSGTNLNSVTSVTFFNAAGGVTVQTFTASTDGTTLSVAVPTGAATGTVRVDGPTGSATTTTKLIVTPPTS